MNGPGIIADNLLDLLHDTMSNRVPKSPDAASDVKLSEIVALQAANLGAARQNASQLTHLEQAVTP